MPTTLLQIKTSAANYLARDVADLTVNGNDLALMALNQVRKNAELMHDFEFQRKFVTVSVDGTTGGSLEDAEDSNGDPVEIKTVIEAGLLDDLGNLRPVTWTTVAESIERQRGDNRFGVPRYPTDGQATSYPNGGSRFTFAGDEVHRWPKTTETSAIVYPLCLEVYAFWPDWTDLSVSDIWTKHAQQYLLWGTIVHLNNLFKEFVPRQEGNLPPPQSLVDAGLAAFIEWDSNKYEQFRRHSR